MTDSRRHAIRRFITRIRVGRDSRLLFNQRNIFVNVSAERCRIGMHSQQTQTGYDDQRDCKNHFPYFFSHSAPLYKHLVTARKVYCAPEIPHVGTLLKFLRGIALQNIDGRFRRSLQPQECGVSLNSQIFERRGH